MYCIWFYGLFTFDNIFNNYTFSKYLCIFTHFIDILIIPWYSYKINLVN